MGVINSKLECIWLPGQSGKTRNVMERIRTLEDVAEVEYGCDGFLNIVISANNRSLVDQTEVRMNNELYVDEENEDADSKIEGSCFKWHSGLKNNNITVGDLADKIKEGDVTMVVCCAHSKRLTYLYQLLQNLEKSKNFTKKINVWIDEADESVKLWSKPALDVTNFHRVNKVTLISATYDSILKKYGKIRVLPCLETTRDIYHRIQDCVLFEEDYAASDATEYLIGVFHAYKKELIKPGTCLFAPGGIERVSHNAIADFLSSQGFAVVVINGERKEIIIPGRATPIQLARYVDVDSGTPEEIGKIIAKIYHDTNLSQFPFAITGHLCLGRGITFQNDLFMFTHGIIFDIANKATAYQTACRLAGNIKGYANYASPYLITTSKMLKTIIEKEETAIDIARHVANNDLTHVDREMIECLYGSGKKPARDEDFLQEWFEYSTFDEAKQKARGVHEKECKDGFYQSSFAGPAKTLSYEEVERAKAGKKTSNMPTDMAFGKSRDRLYIPYKNTSDPTTAIFVVRRLTRINDPKF